MGPGEGIEPSSAVYETAALPLSYTGTRTRTRRVRAERVARVGVEPTLPVSETGVLPLDHLAHTRSGVAGAGVEPALAAHETAVLPLDHPAVVDLEGVEPSSSPCKSDVLPLNDKPGACDPTGGLTRDSLVERRGIEPLFPALQTGARTTSATAPWLGYARGLEPRPRGSQPRALPLSYAYHALRGGGASHARPARRDPVPPGIRCSAPARQRSSRGRPRSTDRCRSSRT